MIIGARLHLINRELVRILDIVLQYELVCKSSCKSFQRSTWVKIAANSSIKSLAVSSITWGLVRSGLEWPVRGVCLLQFGMCYNTFLESHLKTTDDIECSDVLLWAVGRSWRSDLTLSGFDALVAFLLKLALAALKSKMTFANSVSFFLFTICSKSFLNFGFVRRTDEGTSLNCSLWRFEFFRTVTWSFFSGWEATLGRQKPGETIRDG